MEYIVQFVMEIAQLPLNETERLSALYSYNILDTLPEEDFDNITRLASQICDTPISLVSIIDSNRQWFKSKHGIEVSETSRDLAFCAHAILAPEELMMVPDATADSRFANNPIVAGDPHVIFYAGVPLVNDEGLPLGTLCVIDHKPKELTADQKATLKILAKQTANLIELRKKTTELEKTNSELAEINRELEKYAAVIAEDLQSPCNKLIHAAEIVASNYAPQMDADGQQMVMFLKHYANTMKKQIEDLLHYSETAHLAADKKQKFTFSELMQEIAGRMPALPKNFKFDYTQDESPIYTSRNLLNKILDDIITISIRYNDKKKGELKIEFTRSERYYHFRVTDNGCGLPITDNTNIINLFNSTTGNEKDFFGYSLGMYAVRKLIEKNGGMVEVSSEESKGCMFWFSIRK